MIIEHYIKSYTFPILQSPDLCELFRRRDRARSLKVSVGLYTIRMWFNSIEWDPLTHPRPGPNCAHCRHLFEFFFVFLKPCALQTRKESEATSPRSWRQGDFSGDLPHRRRGEAILPAKSPSQVTLYVLWGGCISFLLVHRCWITCCLCVLDPISWLGVDFVFDWLKS